MQTVIGLVVLVFILLVASTLTAQKYDKESYSGEILLKKFKHFALSIISMYLSLGLGLGALYIIALIGIWIREILMWFIEAVFFL